MTEVSAGMTERVAAMTVSRPRTAIAMPPTRAGVTTLACIITFLLPAPAPAQPHVAGRVAISLERGAIEGNVCLSGLAPGDTVQLILNRALSIESVDGRAPRVIARRTEPGEATVVYTLVRESAREAPLCVRYAGSETIYDVDQGTFRPTDESSLIAFNGRSLRARGVARWLPTPFDPALGLAAEALSYRLEIACPDCATIYLNGAEPRSGPLALFESAAAREPYLVAGHLPISRFGESWILGDSPNEDVSSALFGQLAVTRDFYANFLGVPYGPLPDLVLLDAVREPRRGQLWGFFSDPALTLIGMDADEIVDALRGERERSRNSLVSFFAHELAHRYFAWSFGAASPQRDFFGEPFATYLEIKAVRSLIGPAEYAAAVERLVSRLDATASFPPADRAGPDQLRYDGYRYVYLPLVLLSLDRAIGEVAMRAILRDLVVASESERRTASFAWLETRAIAAGVPPGTWRDWRSRCLPPNRLASCL